MGSGLKLIPRDFIIQLEYDEPWDFIYSRFCNSIVFLLKGGSPVNEPLRYKQGAFGAWLGIIINILLATGKMAAGLMAGSRALLADGLHSSADVVGSLAVLLGLKYARVPADAEHPYGHWNAESIAAKIVSIVLIIAGLNIGWDSLAAMFDNKIIPPGALAVWVACISIFVKEILFQYKIRLGRRLKSSAIVANAYEHRGDVYSSIGALVGILGARAGYFILDPLAGVIVSGFVIRMGLKIASEAVSQLMDRVSKDTIDNIANIASDVDGVREVVSVKGRNTGPYLRVDIEIAVDPEISVKEGHDVALKLRDEVESHIDGVSNVMVHVDPYGYR